MLMLKNAISASSDLAGIAGAVRACELAKCPNGPNIEGYAEAHMLIAMVLTKE